MKWSWKIGRVAGVAVEVHFTLLVLLGWVMASQWLEHRSARAVILAALFVVGLFASVLVHELAHAVAARRYRIGTRVITLLPIGGVAQLERSPGQARQELVIALVGPIASALLAVLFFVAGFWLDRLAGGGALAGHGDSLLWGLATANALIAAFNLLPAFPMDGGRVLRAILAMRRGYGAATRIAAAIGKGMAVALGVVGLFTSPMLVVVALFVWLGAAAEQAATAQQEELRGLTVGRAMITRFATLTPDDTVGDALEIAVHGFQTDFPVVERGALVGLLTHAQLLRALRGGWEAAAIGPLMARTYPVGTPEENVADVLPRLASTGSRALPVLRNGRPVGLLTLDHVAELLALGRERAARDRWTPWLGLPRPRPQAR